MLAQSLIPLLVVAKLFTVSPGSSLQKAIDKTAPGDTLRLKAGRYIATPRAYREDICGNCVDPRTMLDATVGFHVKDKPLVIVGLDRDKTVLVTKAGYGLLFENSPGSQIRDLTVTGGKRDPDGRATDPDRSEEQQGDRRELADS